MNVTLTPYNSLLIVLSFVAIAIAGYALKKRAMPGALPLSLLACAMFVWLVSYAMELSSQTLPVALWWVRLEFAGIVAVPVAWLWFAVEYTGSWSGINRRRVWLLGIVPLITMIVILTNEYHRQFWQSVVLITDGPFTVFDSRHGFWFWVHTAYSYLCLLCGTGLIVRFIRRTPGLFRGQIGAMLIAVAAPWIGNIIYLAGLSPWGKLDLTPFALTVSLIAIAWSVFSFRLLEIRPIARDMVLQSMSDGVIAVDEQGRIIEVNRAAQTMIGLPASQIIGKHAREVIVQWPDVVARYRDMIEVAEEIEVTVGAERRWFNVRISPIYDARRAYRGRLFVWRDVTGERLIREELRRNNERLLEVQQALTSALRAAEEGNRVKSVFLAHMSHEIRTPLTAIMGYCQLLEAGIERQNLAQTRADLEAIRVASGHLLSLANNVLEMAWIEAGRSEVHDIAFEVMDVVLDVIATVQPLIRRNRNHLRVEGAEHAGVVQGDPAKVRQILLNLVSNAAKFTTGGEVAVRVAHIGDALQPRIQFQVSDTGSGIAPDRIERLFTPFAIAEEHVGRDQRGVGLGLAISRYYCRLMGGDLSIESAPGRGTTVTFWIPARVPQGALARVKC
ncbi:MAG: PAS domain-containing sensor histidine kinase [Roseiflexus castenholzii]|uniref:histidine kinase N-terminal 7TM domain-containing protein n=1 Tax=Roseiflexus castenholzii TaxID=120962 RepID=UPI000CAEDCEE|nr:MAG: PAS domain-containing sensor histidine kinase [Roseiflexus castenholzii]